jgi:hypothetical protein
VSEDAGGDVDGQAAGDGLGGEHPSEVVRCVGQRLACLFAQAGGFQRSIEPVLDCGLAHDLRLPVGPPLEEVRKQRAGNALVGVVAGDERDLATVGVVPIHPLSGCGHGMLGR